MSTNLKVVLVSIGVIILVGILLISTPKVSVSSVSQGNDYHSTTTYSKLGVPTFSSRQVLLSNTLGTSASLGSVVITGSVAGAMVFMDATSTTDTASTTIAVFPANTATGTYMLDVTIIRGLILETTAGLVPTTTITTR